MATLVRGNSARKAWQGKGEFILQAAVLKEIGLIEVREIPVPEVPPGWVLVKVAVAGICGSDLHGFGSGLYEPGLIMGHEFAGVVVEVGEGVTRLAPGDRVTAHPILPCGECRFCREGRINLCDAMGTVGITDAGAFAEYVALPEWNFHSIGELDFRRAAFAEPLSVVLRAYQRSGVGENDPVLVVGAGTIGHLLVRVLKLHGVKQVAVAEPNAFRRKLVSGYADAAFDPRSVDLMDFSQDYFGRLPEFVFECVGVPQTIQAAVQAVEKGGRVVVLGVSTEPVEMDFLDLMYNEKSLQSVYSNANEFGPALELLKQRKIDPLDLATSEIPLADIVTRGFDRLTQPNDEVKVLVIVD